MVGAMCVCRVYGWLNVRGIVEQHIEDVMTFMIIRTKNEDIDWHMVRHQRVLGDALLQAEIFRRITRSDGRELRLEFLPIARRVNLLINVIMAEDR